jgi:hypothetical protein
MTPLVRLRDYQEEAVAFALENLPSGRWVTLVLPTAAGKTVILQNLTVQMATRRCLTTVPLVTIEDAFAEPVRFREGAPGFLRIREDGGLEALHGFVRSGSGAALTTHALLVRIDLTDLPADLTGCALVIDETHHTGEQETLLHGAADAWHGRGGMVIAATATPFRSDGRPIGPAGAPVFRISRRALAAGGWCPSTIDAQVLRIEGDRPRGVLIDNDVRRIAEFVAVQERVKVGRRFMEARRPTVIRVPPVGAGDLAVQFIAALEAAGVPSRNIINAVGEGNDIREVLLREREIAHTSGFRHRTVDVIVACRRMAEGADWPFCCRVVSVGLSDTLLPTLQLMGRACRDKTRIRDYPREWADVVQYTAFVPDPPADEESRHVRRMLLLAVGIDCDESARDYARFWSDLAAGWRLPPPLRPRLAAVIDPGDDVLAEAGIIGTAAAFHLRTVFDRDPTVGETAALLDRWGDAHGRRALRRLLEALPEIREGVRAALADALAHTVTRWRTGGVKAPEVEFEDALHAGLLAVAARHADLACPVHANLAPGLRGVLTLPKLEAVVADMAAARNATCGFTDQEAARIVLAWRAAHGRWPTAMDAAQDVSRFAGRRATLADVDTALRRRGIDLARICALADVVGRPQVDRIELRRVVGRMPWIPETTFLSAGAILEGRRRWDLSRKFGRPEDLVALEMAARRGWRGLPGGQTLGEILALG